MRYTDCVESTWGEIDCVGNVLFGDYLCSMDPTLDSTGISFTNGSVNYRYGNNNYRIGCVLPSPDNAGGWMPSLGTARNLNATIHFEASITGAMPKVLRYSWLYTVDSVPYHFQMHPEVTGVSPAFGSNAGGTLLKITGRGFPELELNLGDAVNVSVSGVPCTIVNSTYDTAFCVTGPKPAAPPPAFAAPIGGLYPGMRGVEYEFYNVSRSVSYWDLWKLDSPAVLMNNTNTTGSYSTVLTGVWEVPDADWAQSYYCSKIKGFFTAPREGNYSFYLQADDYAQLRGTWIQSGVEVSRLLVNLSYYIPTDEWYYNGEYSAPIPLTAGQPILLQTSHCNGPSIGHVQLGVRMTVPEPRLNSMPEVQKVAVSSTLTPHAVAVKFLYGAGANSLAWQLTVLALNDSKLDDPTLGLQLTVKGGAVAADADRTTVVTIPITVTSADMTAKIEAAFGAQYNNTSNALGSRNASFGVLKARNTGVVTIQIGIDPALAAKLSFEVLLARMVALPPSYNFTPSACSYSSPYLYDPVLAAVKAAAAAASAYDVTKGTAVVLAELQPAPAIDPTGGFFQLRSSSGMPVILSYNTNATVVQSAVRNLTGYDTAVTLTPVRREGAYFARVWDVVFSQYYMDALPALYAEATANTPSCAVVIGEVRASSPPVSGTFRLAFGSDCASVPITIGDTSDTIIKKLSALPGLKAPQNVEISGGPAYGYWYIITFDPIGNPGDLPPLRVADISGLGGINPSATVTTVRDGSTDAFYAPIPAEFLSVAVTEPGAVDVRVNGVPSSCVNDYGVDSSGSVCAFSYSDAATPHLTSASPAELTFDAVSSLLLTITGSGFDMGTGVEVLVGGALCNITSLSPTEIVVSVPDTAPAGVRPVSVNVLPLGFADGSVNVTLQTLFVTGSVPAAPITVNAGAAAWSVLTFTGKGFDYVDCSNNRFLIGTTQCGVLACNASSLTVVYPLTATSSSAAMSVTAQVYDHGVLIDSDTPSPQPTVAVSASAPTITAVARDTAGVTRVALDHVDPSTVTRVYLVPIISDPLNYTAASAAYKARIPCAGVAPAGDGTAAVTCTVTAVPNGRYHALVTLSSGLRILSTSTVLADLFITSVSPNLGSIGGGTTLTITGGGFNPDVTLNAVFLTVPVSSTFLNGIIECMVKTVTATTLTCVTEPHMAADADVGDPYAKNVLPVATLPAPVSVVICDAGYNTTLLRGYCWALDSTPQARCAAEDATACSFGYSTALTPAIEYVDPPRGHAAASNHTIYINGSYMADVSVVQFKQAGAIMGLGTNINASEASVSCDVPDLPPGVYTLLLLKPDGEKSVDPFAAGVFTYFATIAGLSNNVGSLAGGVAMSVTVGGAGLELVGGNLTLAMAANQVDIAGLSCPVLAVQDRWHLTCRAPGINGYVFAEYWNLAASTWTVPDIISYTDPVIARLEKGVNFDWNTTSPAPGIIQSDFFAARFTFYYQIDQSENVTFYLASDDRSILYIDDVKLGSQYTWLNTILTPGVHKLVITYIEFSGLASIKLYVAITPDGGSMGSWALLEWQKVTPVSPGTPLPVSLTVNGVDSDSTCPPATVKLQLPNQPELSFEPPTAALANYSCSFLYSSYRTPSLVKIPAASSGVVPPPFTYGNTTLSVFGNFLTTDASQVNATIANRTCSNVTLTPYVYNMSSTSYVVLANGTNTSQTVITTYNTTKLTCNSPPLPVGTWPVGINVSGMGLARPTASATTDLPVVAYLIKIVTINSPALSTSSSYCRLSMFGGGTLNVSGWGYVIGKADTSVPSYPIYDPQLNRTLLGAWDTVQPCAVSAPGTPTCAAANSSRLLVLPLESDGWNVSFRLSRIPVPNPGAYAGNNSVTNVVLRLRPRVLYGNYTSTLFDQSMSTTDTYFCGGRTPALSNISPAPAPDAGGSLSLTWYMSQLGSQNNSIIATSPGAPSNASVELQVGPTILTCSGATVTSSIITATTYTETVTCKLPAYMPAAAYILWMCVQPFGCGQQPSYTVPLTVSGISATRGSSAGGIVVVITGKGFDLNSNLTAARFGDSNCTITSSNATTLVCTTGSLAARPAGPVAFPLSVTPTAGAAESPYPGFTFTFDPALEATASTISPRRGSTEGGTPVTISGADFDTTVATQVTIGGIPCTSVVVVSSSAITCVTGKPPSSVLRVPLPVAVFQTGRGLARSAASYQYIDLWSRNSTWSGGPLPGEGDSVVIPAGMTVLLDMSPPVLFFIVLEGNLIFDDTLPYINLQSHYILVKGGNFSIGTVDTPYPGRANITMHGAPESRDLPMYGAKSLGVRTGVVTFHGQPKIPVFTKLNATVDPGATQITVNGAVNWQVGDRIVIASSSYYIEENDEATIVALDGTSVPGCTVITLESPLQFTHLGAIHTQADVDAALDMRAEVVVLTRNVVLQGDWTSAKNMYGVQVMVNTPSYLPKGLVRFDNIEITQSGQAFRLGRYSMHWHLMGDIAFQSWVRGCAIHHTYNRAITIHGTHRAIIQNTVAYNTMGHTFFLEDGVETMNLIENNIGIYAKPSYALLETDTTPGLFWITNPNNTVRNNTAIGSAGYGFWYRMLDNPEGPSYTSTVCPKFTPLLEFTNNTAHSNMFYGLRIHPEFYPRNNPCIGFSSLPFQQVPAVFNGLTAYKNGVKGAVASQVGLVQFINMVMGDNGGGPKQHQISGKDNGGNMEMSWVVDDRNRYNVDLTQMAGFFNATMFAQTTTGSHGTAGRWPSSRRVTGIIAQSPVQGQAYHSALMAMVNLTFVDFTPSKPGFSALEHCGKCKNYQGGATCFTAGLKFINADGRQPALSVWNWGHQGIFLDTDGTLLNSGTVPEHLLPPFEAGWSLGPGATWHSAVESELFDPAECVYVRNESMSNNGAFCSPALTFRRAMLHNHGPSSIIFRDLLVTSLATNRTSRVHFTKYNEQGYQFTTATTRDYWLQWDMPFRFDGEYYTMHKMDLLNDSHYVYYTSKYLQVKDHFTVNGYKSNLTDLPMPPLNTTPHGAFAYNKTLVPNSWWWSNRTYNDTKFSMFTSGRLDNYLSMASYTCPDEGCSNVPATVVDMRNGTLYWSDMATWNTSAVNNYTKPRLGDNVTIPYGWNLVIDESPPALWLLVVQGNVSFDPTKDINLTATYMLVMGDGALRAGNATTPHPTKATISLFGARDTPDFGIDNTLNLGSKVLAAIRGGTIELFGRQPNKMWTKLASPAAANASTIALADSDHGWSVGDQILITSTTFNVWQTEIRTIAAVLNNGFVLQLNESLTWPHASVFRSYSSGRSVDLRAEVGLISSNILITATDGPSTHSYHGEKFGGRIVVSGNSTGRFSGIAMTYCGQGGFTDRACIFFDRLTSVSRTVLVPAPADNSSTSTNGTSGSSTATTTMLVANPSMVSRSALIYGMRSSVRIAGSGDEGTGGVWDGVAVLENVMFESYDWHNVEVYTGGNTIQGNLVLGTVKEMDGISSFNIQMPASFYLFDANNFVSGNVAAGSERYGFAYYGVPCGDNFTTGYFLNNTAHSNLAGLWLQAGSEALDAGCTLLRNFTTYMNWDFGIIPTSGITTDVILQDVNVLDTKHAGVTMLRKGNLTEHASIWWRGGILAGQSSPDVCAACSTLSDPGCHKKLSTQSYNQAEPFTAAVGVQSAQFAIEFSIGPEQKPWDKPKGYAIVHGMFNISGVTLAGFHGDTACGGQEAYALMNHQLQMETFYPHIFSGMTVEDVTDGLHQGMYLHFPPDPSWLGETACGDATYTRADGSVIALNCAGPAHVYWRDLDGTLTGAPGTTAGIFASSPRVFPMDQGTPVLPGPCTYSPIIDSYRCIAGSTSFLLDPVMKPKQIPSYGLFGDPQYFVLESRDKDSEDRNFGPVFFNVSGSVDLVTVQADHGCCFTYKCQKRLSMFATYLPTGQTTYITFTGTPAQVFRLWLPYADSDREIIIVINYLHTLNRRFVYVPPGVVPGVSGRISPLSAPPQIGDGTGHGAHFWDQGNSLMYVKLTGGKQLEVRTENAVYVTQRFALTVDNFYDIESIFLSNLAFAMGIDLDRLFIAKVVAGSSVVTTSIAPPVQDIPELTIVAGRDASDPLPAAPPPEPAPVLTAYDLAKLAAMGDNAPNISTLTTAKLNLLRDLWALFDKYCSAIEQAASKTGFQTMGLPQQYIPSLGDPTSDTGELVLPTYNDTTGLPTTPPSSSPPPSTEPSPSPSPSPSPTPSPSPSGSGVGEVGSASASNNGGDTNPAGSGGASSSKSDSSSGSGVAAGVIAGIVVGVVAAVIIAGVIAIIAVRRRHAKRTQPASPPGEPAACEAGEVAAPDSAPSSPGMRGSRPPSPTGSTRDAFVAPGPTAQSAAAAAAAAASAAAAAAVAGQRSPSGGRRASTSQVPDRAAAAGAAGDGADDGDLAPVASPRSVVSSSGASLAAGARSAASRPELIRPLVSTAKNPHSSLPLVPPPEAPLGALAGPSRFRLTSEPSGGSTGGAGSGATKSPAQLQRNDSLARTSAQHDWETDGAAAQRALHVRGRSAASVTEGGSGRAGGGPAPRVDMVIGSEAAATAAAAEQPEPAPLESAGNSGDPNTTLVHRAFETQESYRPRSRASTAALGSRPGSGGAKGGGEGQDLPGSPQQTTRSGEAPAPASGGQQVRPSMVLPGGLAEFAASASLIRSEVAALVIAGAASSSAGFGGAAEEVMREERQGGGAGGSPTAARSPAGLRSDSMRQRPDA